MTRTALRQLIMSELSIADASWTISERFHEASELTAQETVSVLISEEEWERHAPDVYLATVQVRIVCWAIDAAHPHERLDAMVVRAVSAARRAFSRLPEDRPAQDGLIKSIAVSDMSSVNGPMAQGIIQCEIVCER